MEFTTMLGMLGEGFLVTLQLFFVTLIGALPLGVLVALGRMSRFRPISYLFRLYISIMRGTPLMLQLMFIFFAPYYIFGVQLSMDWKFGACAVAFIMNYSAYFAEIYRSGIQSIPRGQYEAAEILGYSKAQTFLRIIFPQVFKRIRACARQRSDRARQGYVAGVHDRRGRDVHHSTRHRFSARYAHGLRGGSAVLLGVHLRGRVRHFAHRKASGLLSRLSEKGTWYD